MWQEQADLGWGGSRDWITSLRCPACIGALSFEPPERNPEGLGRLSCPSCRLIFGFRDGVAVFGVAESARAESLEEIAAEDRWHFRLKQDDEHVRFAEASFRIGERIIRRLERLVPPPGARRVLDLGAGAGPFSWALARRGYRVLSSDISLANMLVAAGYVKRGAFFGRLVSDSGLLPFEGGFFDAIFSKELMHHVPHLSRVFEECGRVLTPGGLLVLHDPMWPLWHPVREDAASAQGIHHVYRHALGHLQALRRAGFHLCDVLDHRGTINPRRSRLLAALDRWLVELLGLHSWGGPLVLKLVRSTLLGGSVTTFAVWRGTRMGARGGTSALRSVVPIDPSVTDDEEVAVKRATQELVPRLVNLFQEVLKESDDELRSRVESLLLAGKDRETPC